MIRYNLNLIICMFCSFLVVLKIYTGSNIFLILFLLVVCFGILIDRIEDKFSYLLFFLPWIYILKFNYDQFSLYIFMSATYVMVALFCMVIYNKKFNFNYLFSYFVFAGFVISVSITQGGSLIEVVGFLLNFTVAFLAVVFVKDRKQFGKYTIVYSIGLLTASIVRLISYAVPHMELFFVDLVRTRTLIVNGNLNYRFAGLDMDPNYFSMHILVAISCLLVHVYHNGEKKLTSIFLIVALSLLGLFSLSKMYLLSILFLIGITIISLMKNDLRFAIKFVFSLILLAVVVTFFSFDYLYYSFVQRFDFADINLNSLTTGRSYLWEMYFDEIMGNFNIFLVGVGFGTGIYYTIPPHNMYITSFYNFGVIGVTVIVFYLFCLREMFLIKTKQKKYFHVLSVSSIPLLVLLVSNLALDSIVMDYFPVHLFFVIFSLTYVERAPMLPRRFFKS